MTACRRLNSSRKCCRRSRVDRLELALQRARAADGDAQVVQELGVDVVERAGEVRRRSPRAGGRRRSRRPRWRAASGSSVEVELGARRPRGRRRRRRSPRRPAGRSPGQARASSLSTACDALEIAVVAAHGGRGDAAAQRRSWVSTRQPHDGLLVVVEDGSVSQRLRTCATGPARASRSRPRAGARSASGRSSSKSALAPPSPRPRRAPRRSRGRAARAGPPAWRSVRPSPCRRPSNVS